MGVTSWGFVLPVVEMIGSSYGGVLLGAIVGMDYDETTKRNQRHEFNLRVCFPERFAANGCSQTDPRVLSEFSEVSSQTQIE